MHGVDMKRPFLKIKLIAELRDRERLNRETYRTQLAEFKRLNAKYPAELGRALIALGKKLVAGDERVPVSDVARLLAGNGRYGEDLNEKLQIPDPPGQPDKPSRVPGDMIAKFALSTEKTLLLSVAELESIGITSDV